MKNNNFNNLENGTYNAYIAKIEYVLRSIGADISKLKDK